ncbi:hypothetical protein Ga0100231_020370 [Opitutaceae bacterium TAV4]|uniref:hypothetical protein n=1 Tax=Geminisphaera colitermitum TaxID=1148786 RepID=UPI000693D7F8|nr:hypothetical protein [Geminisphaera colitermitum]RRJ96261.1 hypothetical protein Ga0100231_020370 [Opitutaceae bacterium TAV4]RRK01216.1 hypothetical protein Ga0100230_021180 [Opitutaceae bacterium TAV3]
MDHLFCFKSQGVRRVTVRLMLMLVVAVLGMAAAVRAGEVRTFTNKQGVAIQAEFVSLTDGTVKIKRDDGRVFDLPLSTLSEADQRWIRAEAAKPAPIPASALDVQMMRATYNTKKDEKSQKGLILIVDEAGYRVSITNRSSQTLSDLTARYRVFVQNDPGSFKNAEKEGGIRHVDSAAEIGVLASFKTAEFRTDAIQLSSTKLQRGYIWADNKKPKEKISDEIVGIQLRIYAGKQLVLERHVPPSLEKTQPW